jgi:hypothetical protein
LHLVQPPPGTIGWFDAVNNNWAILDNLAAGEIDWNDIINKPDIPDHQINADWNATFADGPAYIMNKPVIPLPQVNSDWAANTGISAILNKPTNLVTTDGATFVGMVTLVGDPVDDLDAATKQYVDDMILTGGQEHGISIAALELRIQELEDTRVIRAGDTMTGVLELAADPIEDLEAATKQYVDCAICSLGSCFAGYLPFTGGVMQGPLIVRSNPDNHQEAVSKEYVDALLTKISALEARVVALGG